MRRPQKRSLGLQVLTLLFAAEALAAAPADIDTHRSCAYCGMDRKAYGFSRMLIRYQDGGEVGVCSLHCALLELDARRERAVQALLVADRDTHAPIDATTAFWVLGGHKRGVMTRRAKWAFSTESAAQKFVRDNGGAIVPWAQALSAAREDLVEELADERDGRRARPFGCMAPSALEAEVGDR